MNVQTFTAAALLIGNRQIRRDRAVLACAIEARTLIAANRLHRGVHGDRRKGSRAFITEWNEELMEAWEALAARRHRIWTREGRNFAIPILSAQRFPLVEQSGNA